MKEGGQGRRLHQPKFIVGEGLLEIIGGIPPCPKCAFMSCYLEGLRRSYWERSAKGDKE